MDSELILKNRLKEIRTKQGLSQTRLAEIMGRVQEHYPLHRNRAVQPDDKAGSGNLHCVG